jgi:hypothetical protein
MRLPVLAIALAAAAAAQEYRATLSGRVTDRQGAVIPSARVSALQTETGSRFETVAGADGLYVIPLLPPSAYRVTAEAAGFKRYERSGIQLGANERVAAEQLDWNRRTLSSRFNDARADGVNQIDFSVIKAFSLHERLDLTYRCEFFNATNTPISSAPQLSPTNSNFGLITNQANQPRRIQMALRLVF